MSGRGSTSFDVRPKIRIHATIADARGFVQASPKNPMFPRVPTRYSIAYGDASRVVSTSGV